MATPASNAIFSFVTLPRDVVLEIFKKLSPNDRLIAALACKAWNNAVSDKVLWQDLISQKFPSVLIVSDENAKAKYAALTRMTAVLRMQAAYCPETVQDKFSSSQNLDQDYAPLLQKLQENFSTKTLNEILYFGPGEGLDVPYERALSRRFTAALEGNPQAIQVNIPSKPTDNQVMIEKLSFRQFRALAGAIRAASLTTELAFHSLMLNDDQFEHICGMIAVGKIKSLDLSGYNINDAHAKLLAAAAAAEKSKMEWVCLNDSTLTDEGALAFKEFLTTRQGAFLEVRRTQVTGEAVKTLEEAISSQNPFALVAVQNNKL